MEILTETRDLWVRSLVYVDIGLTNGLNIIVLESLNIWEGGTGSALLGLLVMFGHKSCWSLIFKNILVYEQISWSVNKILISFLMQSSALFWIFPTLLQWDFLFASNYYLFMLALFKER